MNITISRYYKLTFVFAFFVIITNCIFLPFSGQGHFERALERFQAALKLATSAVTTKSAASPLPTSHDQSAAVAVGLGLWTGNTVSGRKCAQIKLCTRIFNIRVLEFNARTNALRKFLFLLRYAWIWKILLTEIPFEIFGKFIRKINS